MATRTVTRTKPSKAVAVFPPRAQPFAAYFDRHGIDPVHQGRLYLRRRKYALSKDRPKVFAGDRFVNSEAAFYLKLTMHEAEALMRMLQNPASTEQYVTAWCRLNGLVVG